MMFSLRRLMIPMSLSVLIIFFSCLTGTSENEGNVPEVIVQEEKTSKEILLTINGKDIILDNPLLEKDGTLMVPVMQVFKEAGAKAEVNVDQGVLLTDHEGITILYKIGSLELQTPEKEIELKTPGEFINEILYVPTRYIIEGLKARVEYDYLSRTCSITTWGNLTPAPYDPVTVSSVQSSLGNPEKEAFVVDGKIDPEAYWSAEGEGSWIAFDLGSRQLVRAIGAAWFLGASQTWNFSIEVSDDGVNFQQIYSGTNSGNTDNIEITDIPDTVARFVRYVGGSPINPLIEFEIYGTNVVPIVPVESTLGDAVAEANTVDGRVVEEIRWSDNGMERWIAYDLGTPRQITGVGIGWLGGNRRWWLFSIEVSNDGEGWTRVYDSVSAPLTNDIMLFDFTDVKAQFIRYIGYGNTRPSSWNSITEFVVQSNEVVVEKIDPEMITPISELRGTDSPLEWYASSNGSSDGDGTKENPWDLQTALYHPRKVLPGDTVFIRGGTYPGEYVCRLNGDPDKSIVLRAYPGERVTFDPYPFGSKSMLIQGSFVWLWDLEFTNSSPERICDTVPGYSEVNRGTSIEIHGPTGVKYINCVFHDAGSPYGPMEAQLLEAAGCLWYNIGYDSPDRGHGHAIYWQNELPTKYIVDGIIFNTFGYGLHLYGSGSASITDFHIEGNVIFNTGELSKISSGGNLVGGYSESDGISLINNFILGDTLEVGNPGFDGENGNVIVKDNIFYDSKLQFADWKEILLEDNVLYGNSSVRGVDLVQMADEEGNIPGITEGFSRDFPAAFIRPNKYDLGRAHIIIINPERSNTVKVDLSSVPGLKKGDFYTVKDGENYFGPEISGGIYNGEDITLPLDQTLTAQAVGNVPIKASHTPVEYGVYVVQKLPSPNRPPEVIAGSDQQLNLGSKTVRLSGSVRGTGQVTHEWTALHAPGPYTLKNPDSLETDVILEAPGTYMFQLLADDGEYYGSDTVLINVDDPLEDNNTTAWLAGWDGWWAPIGARTVSAGVYKDLVSADSDYYRVYTPENGIMEVTMTITKGKSERKLYILDSLGLHGKIVDEPLAVHRVAGEGNSTSAVYQPTREGFYYIQIAPTSRHSVIYDLEINIVGSDEIKPVPPQGVTITPEDNGITLNWTNYNFPKGKIIIERSNDPNIGKITPVYMDDKYGYRPMMSGVWTDVKLNEKLNGHYGYGYMHDNADNAQESSVLAAPSLETEGIYEIFVWYPWSEGNASNVPVHIRTEGGKTVKKLLNQRINGNYWHSLGSYSLDNESYIKMSNSGADGLVIFDAIKFSYVGDWEQIAEVDAGTTEWTDTNFRGNKKYHYRLKSVNSKLESEYSEPAIPGDQISH